MEIRLDAKDAVQQRFERPAVAGTLEMLVGRPHPDRHNNTGKEIGHDEQGRG